ncbi:MAG: [FeFe] hydrogenase H-cluster maturation GTPase HydF [Planctomycetes bacterium]|nr:[FeFe] hydrogenase H-cluster maturation GTPase HydF [Planctomycetota bacterium]
MTATPKGFRLHIGIFGRRNAGKSTLLNLAAGQAVSIVSPTAGTTTDPVEKPMEFIPMGPVVWIDTAGIDDAGDLGSLRSARARAVMDRVDLAVIVFHGAWGDFEQTLFDDFAARGVPVIVVRNKTDLDPTAAAPAGLPEGVTPVPMAAGRGEGLEELRQAILAAAPADYIESPAILRDLVPPGSCVVLVTPIDKEAPKGRLILPQVQALRDALDGECWAVVVKETGLAHALAGLAAPPSLVVTDSQAFRQVAAETPAAVPMTGFSVLYARTKGDLSAFARGAAAIPRLRDGDVVLVAESCTHHQEDDDIGRVKLPAWIRERSGAAPTFRFVSGHDFPDDLSGVALVLHCGACMTNRRAVLSRIARCHAAGVPIVNYGIAIAECLGLMERALGPFPDALQAYREAAGR